MVEDFSLSDYSSYQQNDRLPIWRPKETKPEAKASDVLSAPAPADSCEFTGDIAFVGCASKLRLCQIDGCSCTFLVILTSKFGASARRD